MNGLTKGVIVDEIGCVSGRYWLREGQNRYCINWCGLTLFGYTEEGVWQFANKYGYQLFEQTEWEAFEAC